MIVFRDCESVSWYIFGQYVILTKEKIMKWTAPQANDMRFGFEITAYIMTR